MVVHTSKAQKKEVAISPVRSRLSNFAKFFESKAVAKRMAIQAESRVTRRTALRSMAALLGLSVVSACAPAAVLAEPKEPTGKQKQTELPEVDNIEPVTKAIIATPENFDRMENGEYTKTESFVLLPMRAGSRGSSLSIYLRDDSKKDSLGEQVGHTPARTASHIARKEIDLGSEGKLLLIADDQGVVPFHLKNNEVTALGQFSLRHNGLNTGVSFIGVIMAENTPLIFILPSTDGKTFKSKNVFAKLIYGGRTFSKEFARYTGEDISLVSKESDSSSLAILTP